MPLFLISRHREIMLTSRTFCGFASAVLNLYYHPFNPYNPYHLVEALLVFWALGGICGASDGRGAGQARNRILAICLTCTISNGMICDLMFYSNPKHEMLAKMMNDHCGFKIALNINLGAGKRPGPLGKGKSSGKRRSCFLPSHAARILAWAGGLSPELPNLFWLSQLTS